MEAPCGTRKRFREVFASSLDYMGLGAPEHFSPSMQKQHGTRDEGNTAHTLHARRLVLTCRLLPLAVSISFINSYISQTATTLLVLDEANIVCGCATSQLLS